MKKEWKVPHRKPDEAERAYFVYDYGGRWPIKRHENYARARHEAQRLAMKLPGRKFHVVATSMIIEVPAEAVEETAVEGASND